MDVNNGYVITSPIFLLVANQACNLCQKMNPVMSLATLSLSDPSDENFASEMQNEGILLGYIETLPEALLTQILELHPNYRLEHSLTASADYYMSVCKCGGHYGDHYVHKQIRTMAFLEPNNLRIEKILTNETCVIPCDFTSSGSVADLLRSQQ